MSAKDDQYMYEINKLEGERDYWRNKHSKLEAEVIRLREESLLDVHAICDKRNKLRPEARRPGVGESIGGIDATGG